MTTVTVMSGTIVAGMVMTATGTGTVVGGEVTTIGGGAAGSITGRRSMSIRRLWSMARRRHRRGSISTSPWDAEPDDVRRSQGGPASSSLQILPGRRRVRFAVFPYPPQNPSINYLYT